MRTFKDKNGQSWEVELTIGLARKTFDVARPETLSALIDDPFQRFDLLWLLCQSQATNRNISQDQFDSLLADESAYAEASEALLGTIEDFFRRIGKESLSLLIGKTREAAIRLDALAKQKVSGIDQALTRTIAEALRPLDEVIAKAGS